MDHWWLKYLPQFISKWLVGRHVLQKIVGNTGWLFADHAVRMAVGFFVVILVARYLGPEQFGQLNYAMAIVALLVPLCQLGLSGIAVRDIVRKPDMADSILGTSFVLKLAGGAVLVPLSLLLIVFLRPDDTVTQMMVGLIGVSCIIRAFEVNDFWFRSQVQVKYTVIARGSAYIITSILKVILVLLGASVLFFAGAVLLESILSAVGLVIAYRVYGRKIGNWRYSLDQAKKLLKVSWPLMFSAVFVLIYLEIDKIMLGEMLGDSEVGQYSAAVTLSVLWYFIPMAIRQSILPTFVKDREGNRELYHHRLQQLLNLMALLSYVTVIPISLLSGPIVLTIFGPEYAEAARVLTVHIFACIFIFLDSGRTIWINVEGFTSLALVANALGAITNIALNLVLIRNFGIMGAAYATLISYMVYSIGVNVLFKQLRPIFWMQMKALFFFGWRESFTFMKVKN